MNNVIPNGATLLESTNTLGFNVTSAVGVASNGVVVTLNGVIVSNLVFSGSSNNWNVSYPHLEPDTTLYTASITVTDGDGNIATATRSFDTFSAGNYTWEAEDFDYGGGHFIDGQETNAYSGLSVTVNVDTHQVNFGGTDLYRPNGMDTEINGDTLLVASTVGPVIRITAWAISAPGRGRTTPDVIRPGAITFMRDWQPEEAQPLAISPAR